MEPTTTPAGWHPDPTRRYEFRYFNGERWTADVSVHGQRFVDPAFGASGPGGDGVVGASATPPAARRGFAITAFVIGLGSFITGWVPFIFALAIGGAITALVFGVLALGRIRRGEGGGKGFAVAGSILAVAAFGTSFIGFQLTRSVWRAVDDFVDVGEYTKRIERCTLDGTVIEMDGRITNRDDQAHAYSVTVSYVVDGDVADTDILRVESVAPGATGTFHGTGFARGAGADAVLQCRIDTVTGPLPFSPAG